MCGVNFHSCNTSLYAGIAEGVTDLFYEPYQGIIQGPGEFFEGLGLGALSLLGHTFGKVLKNLRDLICLQ